MKLSVLVLLIISLVSGTCSESGVSRDKYNSGWARAQLDGCGCNPNFSQFDNSKEAQAGLGWADGYVDGCVSVRHEKNCE